MSPRRIAPSEAATLMESGEYAYLDVRSQPEFELGHPAGAYNVPWQHQGEGGLIDNPDFLNAIRRTFAPDTPLIVGCHTGYRSLAAAARLQDAGFKHVLEMRGGYAGARDAFGRKTDEGWCDAGLPTAVDAHPGRAYRALLGDGT